MQGKISEIKKVTILFLFFIPLSINLSISQTIVLKGKIKSESQDTEGIHVINKTRGKATITDGKGYFSIPVNSGDTLAFSAVQFWKKMVVVDKQVLSASFLIVEPEEKVAELDEVIVKNMSGNLVTDLKRTKTDSINAMTLNLPNAHVIPRTQTERKLYTATDWNFHGLAFSIDPIINAFSGRTKMLKDRQRKEQETAKLEGIHNGFDNDFFISLGIPEEKIYDFLYFCSVQIGYHQIPDLNNKMFLQQFLQKHAKTYVKINTPSPTSKD
ncbi:hypothetical protein [Sinomicrobium sp. M5D2P17]